jgi:glycosyltransferase involved in cell wall biosynthesis
VSEARLLFHTVPFSDSLERAERQIRSGFFPQIQSNSMSPEIQSRGEIRVILVGTDPVDIRGGIGTAMQGHIRALNAANLPAYVIPSYSPVLRHGRWLLAVKAIPVIIRAISHIRRSGALPIHYGHAGSWPSMVREAVLALISRIFGARTILQLHSPDVDNYLNSSLGRLFVKIAVAPANSIGVLTPWWKQRLQDAGIKKPVVVIPNPLPQELESSVLAGGSLHIPARQRRDDVVTILSMARLVKGKGVDTVIEAISLLPAHVQLVVAGDGPLRGELELLSREKGLVDRVRFAGWVADKGKTDLLSSVDIFCLPSRNDSFGMCFIEAMAHCVPVIALGWGPIRDVVPDGRAGILVAEATPELVADAIRRLLDVNLRTSFGEGGRKWVLQEYSADAVGRISKEFFCSIT